MVLFSIVLFLATVTFVILLSVYKAPEWAIKLNVVCIFLTFLYMVALAFWSEHTKPVLTWLSGQSDVYKITLKNAGTGYLRFESSAWHLKTASGSVVVDNTEIDQKLRQAGVNDPGLDVYKYSHGGALGGRSDQVIFSAKKSDLDGVVALSVVYVFLDRFGRKYRKKVHILTEPLPI